MVRLWTVVVCPVGVMETTSRPGSSGAGPAVWSVSSVCGVCRRSPGSRSRADVQPLPSTQKGWAAVVVMVPPSLVSRRQVGVFSWVWVSRTRRGSSSAVSGLWARTVSPASTRAMGLVVPSAMRTGVSAVKQALAVAEVNLL